MTPFPISPMAKPRMTRRDAWKKRPVVTAFWLFRDTMKAIANDRKFILGDKVNIGFIIPMPDSWSEKKKMEMLGTPHQSRPDIDNFLKGVFDCLLANDSTVYAVKAFKIWGKEGQIIFFEDKEFDSAQTLLTPTR